MARGTNLSPCKHGVETSWRTVVKRDDSTRPGKLFHELYTLRVVVLRNLLVIRERRILQWTPEELEAGSVQRDRTLLSAKVLNLDLMRLLDPILLWSRRVFINVVERL